MEALDAAEAPAPGFAKAAAGSWTYMENMWTVCYGNMWKIYGKYMDIYGKYMETIGKSPFITGKSAINGNLSVVKCDIFDG